jgi:hypothetical protein
LFAADSCLMVINVRRFCGRSRPFPPHPRCVLASVQLSTIQFGDRLVRISRAGPSPRRQPRTHGPNSGPSRTDQANSSNTGKVYQPGRDKLFHKHCRLCHRGLPGQKTPKTTGPVAPVEITHCAPGAHPPLNLSMRHNPAVGITSASGRSRKSFCIARTHSSIRARTVPK